MICTHCHIEIDDLRGEDIVAVRGERVVSRCPRCRRLVESDCPMSPGPSGRPPVDAVNGWPKDSANRYYTGFQLQQMIRGEIPDPRTRPHRTREKGYTEGLANFSRDNSAFLFGSKTK